LVLRDSILEYYESESAYLTKEEGGMKGSISIKNGVKITPASPSGDGKSAEGYHFTIESNSPVLGGPSPSHHRTTMLECACLDAESRDSWVQKIRESYHHGVVEGRRVLIAIYVKPEEEPLPAVFGRDLGRIHYFHAENEEDCRMWTETLKKATADAHRLKRLTSTSAWTRVHDSLRAVYTSNFFQFTVVMIIIANFLANIVEFELMSESEEVMNNLDSLDLAFTLLFAVELLVNMISHFNMMPFPFLSDFGNITDIVVVIVSLATAVTTRTNTFATDNGSIKVIRVMRVFRVVRVFKRLVALRLIIRSIVNSAIPVMNTFLVMLIATSVYAILGVGLFSDRPLAAKFFGHFSAAFFTMFQCVSGDGWASGGMPLRVLLLDF
jgi:hypothetical protein